jgi:hypothetical protein
VALKFVVAHPAVTCAIPATSAGGRMCARTWAPRAVRLPDAALRARMAAEVAAL